MIREHRSYRCGLIDGIEHRASDHCGCGYEWHVVKITPTGRPGLAADFAEVAREADEHRAQFHRNNPDGSCSFIVDKSDPRFRR